MIALAHPLALLLLVPGALALWLWRTRRLAGLPGDWAHVIDRPLQGYVAGRAVLRGGASLALPLAIWALLTFAATRPSIQIAAGPEFTNIAGRVIALDLGAGLDINHQRNAAARILDQSPGIPTALVAVTGDAFDAVPLTRDRAFAARYLNVITPDVMPVGGRSVAVALAHGEAILTRAGVVAGQMVLVTGGAVPDTSANAPARWSRAIVVPPGDQDAWTGFADAAGARLVGTGDLADVGRDLDHAISRARRQVGSSGRFDLTPVLLGLALVLWLMLFRRRRAA